jgi:hypothetical protein
MALPLLGIKVRLKGAAAKTFECSYSATFVDGSAVGPVSAGKTCEAESLAALESFQVVVRPRGGATADAWSTDEVKPAPTGKKPAGGKSAAGRPVAARLVAGSAAASGTGKPSAKTRART